MAVSIREDYRTALEEQRMEVREMVLAGLKEVKAVKQKISARSVTDWRKNTGMQQYKIKINELAEQDS